MTRLTVTLPEPLNHFVEEQVARQGYRTASDYLADLVHEAQIRVEKQDLETRLVAGLESPKSDMAQQDWTALRQRILDRHPGLQGE